VQKHRGQGQRDGTHGLEIRDRGVEVYPQLLPEHDTREFDPELLSSGIEGLDELLGGGIECGSITFVSGPTGVGKTTTATHFLTAACERGETVLSYHFEESAEQFTYRSEQLGLPVSKHREEGNLQLREIETLTRSAEEVGQQVRTDVETHDPAIILLDGIDGYKISFRGDEERLTDRLHALTRYLKNRGISVILLDGLPEVTGGLSATSGGMSYIADNVILLTYLEGNGDLKRAVGVLKKRLGGFENRFHWFEFGDDGLTLGGTVDDIRRWFGGTTGTPGRGDDRPRR